MEIIQLFTDLEGTIIKEGDRENEIKYDKEEFNMLLEELRNLKKVTGMDIRWHLVSPIFMKDMKKVIDAFDADILQFNKKHDKDIRLSYIEAAAAQPQNALDEHTYMKENIFPIDKIMQQEGKHVMIYAKRSYVKKWMVVNKDKAKFNIYCGNGLNDEEAIKYVKEQPNGITVAPKNSTDKILKMAEFVSDEADIKGVTDGIKKVNQKIVEIMNKNKDKGEEK